MESAWAKPAQIARQQMTLIRTHRAFMVMNPSGEAAADKWIKVIRSQLAESIQYPLYFKGRPTGGAVLPPVV